MSADQLEAARTRYTAAYEAYRQASRRLAEKLAKRLIPSQQEIDDEENAAEQLGVARRALMDAINAATRR